MNWSFRIGRVFGIPVRVHFTFLLLLAFFFLSETARAGPASGSRSVIFMVLLFACVFLHELGHSLVAMRFGIAITSITLYPFGGIAALTEIPREPAREILIAIAGPMVNFAIAAGLFVGVSFFLPAEQLGLAELSGADLLRSLFSANLLLGLFNLIPAYPMDGGRILRGILATRMPYLLATRWAARIGKVFAALFVAAGVMLQDWWLPILGVFLYMGATSEEQSTAVHTALSAVRIRDVVITEYVALSPAATLSEVLARSLHTFQEDFPVIRDGTFLGVVGRGRMIAALREEGRDLYVQGVLQPVNDWVGMDEPALSALRKMQIQRVALLPVVDGERLAGIVTLSGILRAASLLATRDEPPAPVSR